MKGPVINILIFQAVLCTTSGLTLKPSSDLTVQNFSLVCDFDGAGWTSSLLFSYDGNAAGGCGPPLSQTCLSSLGNITTLNTQSVTFTLDPSNILTHGNALWQCTHAGLSPGEYNATIIAVCSDGAVKQSKDKIDISCSCGFPSVKANLKYKVSNTQEEGPKVVDLQNSTGNCVGDSRAMDFIYREDNIPIGASELCVSFTTLSQISESKEECIHIDCKDPLVYGLLPVIFIVFIVSVIISFIMKIKLPVKIYEKFQDLSIGKIGISMALINIVAIGTGLGLGYGLRSGQGKCDRWELALVLSLLCGVILSVLLIVIILFCCKKENEDDGFNLDNCFRKCSVKPADKKETDRSNGDRARSPASASEVKVQTGKKSQNKPTEKVMEESYVNTKPRPLPETPKGRKDQLDPIKSNDGEVENSEKKKKKKKKKRKEPTEGEKTELQE